MDQHVDNLPLPPPSEADPLDQLFADDTLQALAQAIPAERADTAEHKIRRGAAAMHLLRSLDPQHPIEVALATQAVLSHYCSVAAFRRATAYGQPADTTAREIENALRASEHFTNLLHELDWHCDGVSPTAATPSRKSQP
jgi:hypothetical protein